MSVAWLLDEEALLANIFIFDCKLRCNLPILLELVVSSELLLLLDVEDDDDELDAKSAFSGDAINLNKLVMVAEDLLALVVLGVAIVVEALLRVVLGVTGSVKG